MADIDILQELIPNVSVSNINLETTRQNLLKTTLSLVIQENLSDDLVSKWFSNINFKKYLKIKVYQCLSPDIASFLSLSEDFIELLNSNIQLDPNDLRLKLVGHILETNNIQDILKKFRTSVKEKIISVDQVQDIKEFNQDDENNLNIPFTVSFTHNEIEPEHLSFFIFSFLDIQSLAKDHHLDYDNINFGKENGKLVSEIVIDDHNISSSSSIFLDKENNLWTGPIHILDDGTFKTGIVEDETSQVLTKQLVENSKVQDFRIRKQTKELNFDFSFIHSKLDNIESKINLVNIAHLVKINNTDYFTDLHISKDKDGDVKFLFGINFGKLIKERTIFGSLIKDFNTRLIERIVSSTKIRQLKIYRRRVKKEFYLNSLGSPTIHKEFDLNEFDETIINSHEKTSGHFIQVNNEKAALKEIEPVFDKNFSSIRFFTGMDKTTSDLTDGLYQYYITLSVDDNTPDFIEEELNKLQNSKAMLVSYYNEASKPSLTNFLKFTLDPHIKKPSNTSLISGKSSGNFDPKTNKFTQEFINEQNKKYQGDFSQAPWIAPVLTYVEVLDLFGAIFKNNIEQEHIQKQLQTFISPNTGNLSGILFVLDLLDQLITLLQKMGISSKTVSPRRQRPVSTRLAKMEAISQRSNNKNSFNITHYFDHIIDSNDVKKVSYDYLSNGHDDTKNTDGIKKIDSNIFIKRINNETLKYFNNIEPDINLQSHDKEIFPNDKISNTSFSFLSPSRIDFSKQSFILSAESLNKNETPVAKTKKHKFISNIEEGNVLAENTINSLHSAIHLQNIKGKLPITPNFGSFKSNITEDKTTNTDQETEAILEKHMAEFGIEITPIDLEAQIDNDGFLNLIHPNTIDIKLNKNINNLPEIRTEELNKNFNKNLEIDNKGKITVMNQMTAHFGKTNKNINNISSLDLKNTIIKEDKIIGLKNNITQDEFKKLPNQIKAIFHFNSAKGITKNDKFKAINIENAVDNINILSTHKLNFHMLKRIERLVGFEEEKNGEINIKHQIWQPLTESDYNNLSGKEVICRMVDHEEPKLGIFKSMEIDGLTYDQYFLLTLNKTNSNINNKKTNIKVGNKYIDIDTNKIDKAVKLHLQNKVLKTHYIKNNIIPHKKFTDILNKPEAKQAIKNKKENIKPSIQSLIKINDIKK